MLERDLKENRALKLEDYPDLYIAADKEAKKQQKRYFRLLIAQYFCLFVASSATLLAEWVRQEHVLLAYFIILVTGALSALLLATLRPHQQWYQMRALAESCKTLTWRYTMSAEPFNKTLKPSSAAAMLAKRLHDLVSFQPLNTAALVNDLEASEQVTEGMNAARELGFEERRRKYLEERIDNQLAWYRTKAASNKRTSVVATSLVVFTYFAAIFSALFQIVAFGQSGSEEEQQKVIWLSEPLLVLAASFIGYAQAKRFAELSSSYALTALEIQQLKSGLADVEDEQAFASYVNEAEGAFSREHTQWIARVV